MESRNRTLVARYLGLAFLVGGVFLVTVFWAEISKPIGSGGGLEQIVLARPVVTVLRITLVTVAAYIMGSLVGLALEGRWLVKAGPAEVEPARSLDVLGYGHEQVQHRLGDLEGALDEIWDAISEAEIWEEEEED